MILSSGFNDTKFDLVIKVFEYFNVRQSENEIRWDFFKVSYQVNFLGWRWVLLVNPSDVLLFLFKCQKRFDKKKHERNQLDSIASWRFDLWNIRKWNKDVHIAFDMFSNNGIG